MFNIIIIFPLLDNSSRVLSPVYPGQEEQTRMLNNLHFASRMCYLICVSGTFCSISTILDHGLI